MACIPIPAVPIPTLPLPLRIDPPALPSIPFDAELCCKIIAFTIVPPPLPLPPLVLNPAVNAAIASAVHTIQAYIDALPVSCPKELQAALPA